ncbi:MAG: acyltransferase domain-containing protein, partial [Catenulispora sp.]|nr:acyltransferase domain-containing protein [Catenulispora sp.]
LDLAATGFSLAATRTRFEHRAVVLGRDRGELLAGLASLSAGGESSAVVTGTAGPLGGVAFMFPGQGSQWAGMGRELYAAFPVFARSIDACAHALAEWVDWSLLDVIRGVRGAPTYDRVDVVQPALFSVMVSLAALWRSWGVEPAAVIGHSQGEIAAAHVCGALSLRDATRVVALRSKALVDLNGHGGMASVAQSERAVEDYLARSGDRVSVAVVNGPRSVVVSGEPDALDAFVAKMTADGVQARRIKVDYASHSHYVTRVRDDVVGPLAGIRPRSGELPFYSTLHGEVIDTARLDAGYWYDNLRQKVRFETSAGRLAADGFRVFVEMSPHPVLTVPVQDIVEDLDQALVLSSARRGRGEVEAVLTSLAALHTAGGPADLGALFTTRRRVDLPTYAFQRRRYWLSSAPAPAPTAAAVAAEAVEEPAGADSLVPLSERVGALAPDDARALVLDHVLERVAVVLGHPSSASIDPDGEFMKIGFDSMLSSELSKRLTASTGHKLRANLVLRHPSPRQVAGHLVSLMTPADTP